VEERARVPFALAAYERRSRSSDCFVCAVVRGDHDLPVHEIYRDAEHLAFLGGYPSLPVLRGYVILSPNSHKEEVVDDFTEAEYLRLHALAHRLGRAVRKVVPTERLYLLSLGSKQANAHVHWHLAPLPPGVPYKLQQFTALMPEHVGLLDLSDGDQAALAAAITAALADGSPISNT